MKRFRWWLNSDRSSSKVDLESYFTVLRDTDYEEAGDQVQHWLHRVEQARQALSQPRRQKVFEMIHYVRMYRVKLAFVSVLLALFVVACHIPVEQEETFGYMLSGEIERRVEHPDGILDVLHEYEIKPIVVIKKPQEENLYQFALVMKDASRGEAEARKAELEGIDGMRSVYVEPLEGAVTQPAYKAALHAVWRTNIRPRVESREVKAIIDDHLATLQMHGVRVSYKQGVLEFYADSLGENLDSVK